MKKEKMEFYVGILMIIGLSCCAYLIIVLGGANVINKNDYRVFAYFSSVAGLKAGANVEMAGVEIGNVISISLDMERLLAKVELGIRENIKLAEDVLASVKTSGVIGDKYINLSPGGSEIFLESGDTIFNTESAIDIEALVSKYIFGKKEEE
ncbi:ABC-type transporter involved in resistance to organic solvents, periplasmic binding component [Desulfamplus magnetovallimortis]|uniref:ABC-type transporter involved in resistance to organic solvents, periplasmic binding component n=1 Tax=Desulfamplus magnetovallimortis TaxID=1246637 RepID=A0A1W1HDH6_9BACT|nr:outer membrane lipid asymmetry maintenance protein MlaD [Desulfamplus magnetovallimortis]SLM30483.1 ABC-type transporter involved in resistance to organic solvents, periplasmic binding component [Desulfamplus magnetovallimortis]